MAHCDHNIAFANAVKADPRQAAALAVALCRALIGGCSVRRYFFHIMDGRVSLDHEGKLLADIWEVRKEAINRTAAYLALLDNALLFGGPWSMTVADEQGKTVFSLNLEAHTYSD